MKIPGNSSVASISKSAPVAGKSGKEQAVESNKSAPVEAPLAAHDIKAEVEKADGVDMSEVSRIRDQIANGTLKLDAEALAKAILDVHQ